MQNLNVENRDLRKQLNSVKDDNVELRVYMNKIVNELNNVISYLNARYDNHV